MPQNHIVLDWMIPAPAQGVIGIGCRQEETHITEALRKINHRPTEIRSLVERQFLRTVEGGCSAPVGALCTIDGDKLELKAGVFELDGSNKVVTEKTYSLANFESAGKDAADEVLANGGKSIMQKISDAG